VKAIGSIDASYTAFGPRIEKMLEGKLAPGFMKSRAKKILRSFSKPKLTHYAEEDWGTKPGPPLGNLENLMFPHVVNNQRVWPRGWGVRGNQKRTFFFPFCPPPLGRGGFFFFVFFLFFVFFFFLGKKKKKKKKKKQKKNFSKIKKKCHAGGGKKGPPPGPSFTRFRKNGNIVGLGRDF